ncbi:hypothetical protein [Saccharospirillum salsuginis]|uniref:Uncharacterized protein n=1 Tax=Saccharospirillum salsuginis TaxID=418750 RepID=A0A918NGZ1_9GAMM|nr:hypothetical protein [Saccharospirillum salsuginis]GGX66424.1 hypothetical protein GCM10007392_37620 [Saccharospirillum salsuginis]
MNLTKRQRITLFIGIAMTLIIAWSGLLDSMASEYANDGLIQAGAFYGTIRFLNAIISTFQEIEVNFVISSLAVGELLDPVNDLVEYVSEGLKLAIGSYLLQRIIVEITSTILFNILFTVSCLSFLLSFYVFGVGVKVVLFRLFVSALFLRFAVTIMMLVTTAFSTSFLDEKISKESATTSQLSSELNESKQAAADVSEELEGAIQADLGVLKARKDTLQSELKPIREEYRKLVYEIDKHTREFEKAKDEIGGFNSLIGNEETDKLKTEIESMEDRANSLQDRSSEIDNEIEHINDEIERVQQHLFSESDGFLSKFSGGVTEAWSYISSLADRLVNSTLTALTLFLFKMLLLPLLFLYILIKSFKYVWGIDLPYVAEAATSRVNKVKSRARNIDDDLNH